MDIHSKIDSDRFGYKIGKINESFFNDKSIDKAIQYFKENNYECIFSRIDHSRLDLINGLEQRGFTTKDVQYTLRNSFKNYKGELLFKPTSRTDGYVFREALESETDQIVDIAKNSFSDYGHYSTDSRLNQQDCLDAYVDWTYNSCINNNVADKIFVAEKNNEVAGYIAYKKFIKGDLTYAAGVLGAVNPKHRGNGLFSDIDIAGLEWGMKENMNWHEHNVLIDNFASMKAHMNVGFKPHESMTTLHGWMDEIKL